MRRHSANSVNDILEQCCSIRLMPLLSSREGCFTTSTFQSCLQNLLLDQESQFFQELVDIIGKRK